MQMSASAKAAKNQSKLEAYKAEVAEKNAGIAQAQGQADADDTRRASRRRLAEMRAAFGSNGIDVAGSPLDVLSDSATEGELEAKRIEYQAGNRAEGYSQEAGVARSSSKVAKDSLSGIYASGALSMLGAAAGGTSKVYKASR
jgi:hypothetical protein